MNALRGFLRTSGLLLMMVFLCGAARAASVGFTWRQNTDPGVAGYNLYYGPTSRNYTNHVVLGLVTTHTMSNLVNGATYYFALTAFNTNDVESDYTAELRFPNAPVIGAIQNQSTPEDTPATISVFVYDADTAVSNLTLSATSGNQTLVPGANFSFSGTSSNRTMVITPAANQIGSALITVTVSDGSLSTSTNFTFTVSNTPDRPTISGIADVVTDEDVATGAISFTINDADTAAANLTVVAATSNSTLIPTNRITLAGTSNARTITLRPTTNLSGSATITLTVSDGSLTASTNFTFTVRAVNDLPTITQIGDFALPEDTQTNLAFTINDIETAAANLQVTASSSAAAIVPQQNITFGGGTGTNRTVTVRPATNAVGSAVITVTVNDGQASVSEAFTVTYTGVNDAPYVSQPADLVVGKFDPVPPVSFTAWDAETAANALTISVTSSNTTLLPTATNMVVSSSGTNRTLTLIPIGMGTSQVGIHVSDGTATNRVFFRFTVAGTNDGPTISGIADVITDEDVVPAATSFTVNDLDTPVTNLTVVAATSNSTLIPTNRITLAGTSNVRTITLRPATNQSGSATITLTVSDGILSASTNFTFTVRAVNDSPTITPIADLTLPEDTQTNLTFTINDVETAVASLQVTASSSVTAVVPLQNITLNGGTGTNRTITVRPATNVVGSSVITVSVSDGQASVSESFTVTYAAVNDAPYVSRPPDLVVNKLNPVPPIPFTVWDTETAANALNITITSSNATFFPTATNAVVSGTGTNRTLTLFPVGIGMTQVGINVSDGALTNRAFFLLTITGSNNPPVITVPGALSGSAGVPIVLPGISVADPDVKTTNMNFTINATNGTISIATNVAGGVTAAQVTGNNSGAVTIIAQITALNATFANTNGLRYTSRTGFSGTDIVVLNVSDNGSSGLGGVKTDRETIAIQIGASVGGIEGWRATYFSAADLADPTKEATVWGDLADPDGDGHNNLLEYALGLNPLGSEPQDSAFVTSTVSSGGNQYLTLAFNARITEPALQYIPEVSADNVTWAATAVLISTTPVNADFQRLTYRDSVAIAADSARFMRLRVVRNTP